MAVIDYTLHASSPLVLLACTVCVAVLAFRWYSSSTHGSIAHIRGPPVKNPILGNIRDFSYQENVGDLDFAYMKEYGTAWRLKSSLGKSVLMVADPKALQHIFHKSGYLYPKTTPSTVRSFLVTGKSILWAPDGNTHSRHRKIMNPAFSAPQLRSFLTLFRKSSSKLCQLWRDEISPEGSTVLVNKWLARTTLDVIGEAAFDFDFGAMQDNQNELSVAYDNMFTDATLHTSPWNAIFEALWDYIPDGILKQVQHIPTREYARFKQTLGVFAKYSKRLIAQKSADLVSDTHSKDVMSVLVRANAAEDAGRKLNDEEMVSQMSALTLAGHETTANTISWLLYELAKHPDFQEKMHAEIVAKRAEIVARGDEDFTMEDLESLEYLQAAIKETLRYHPIAFHLNRMASQDDVLPLAYPVMTTAGEKVTEIPVRKGQAIMPNLAAYNRIPEIWGADAHEWNPMRYIENRTDAQVRVGMYANLMTFSAGVRGCIGWRFSLIEMQAIISDLVENFRFGLPKDRPEVLRVPAAVMAPMIKGRMEEGAKLPLHVTVY
uniref:PAH-inducible cytochrome P450 monooxygenase PC-PAH 4 n=1 Tax=Phanerodontia chrysosporium TaxID=2822231 RepID=E2DYX0_PHACH|nr:PAH-inducible cytochrome P450 monooxygenase PC-PAH 4 [Phanerodontia chrysosporium]